MNSIELVKKTILGLNESGVTPVYGWVKANLSDMINDKYGSVHNFEDAFGFDLAHIFGGPQAFDTPEINRLRDDCAVITPQMLLDMTLSDPNREEDYAEIKNELTHQRISRGRFCYVQTWGTFEAVNGIFGIQNHLLYMALYPDLLGEIYKRLTPWTLSFINNIIDLGIDMVHISDDWGAQNGLLFSPDIWRRMIEPHHREMVRAAHERGVLASLHSDGNVNGVLEGIAEIGYDLVHPYQESAGMDYSYYLNRYHDQFAIMGGLCVQTAIGFGNPVRLENEIRRLFSLLKNKRWVFCTTHYVQQHCSMEELEFAFDLALELAKKSKRA